MSLCLYHEVKSLPWVHVYITPLFWQPLTKGSWAGLVSLTAYMAAKIGIEEYLLDTFLKIHYQLEGKLLGEKLCQTKVHLLIGYIEHAEILVRSPRRWSVKPCMAGKAPPFLRAHSRVVDYIFRLVLPCETFAESSDDKQHSAWGITEPFILGDEMSEFGGLVRLLLQEANTFHGHVLNRRKW